MQLHEKLSALADKLKDETSDAAKSVQSELYKLAHQHRPKPADNPGTPSGG